MSASGQPWYQDYDTVCGYVKLIDRRLGTCAVFLSSPIPETCSPEELKGHVDAIGNMFMACRSCLKRMARPYPGTPEDPRMAVTRLVARGKLYEALTGHQERFSLLNPVYPALVPQVTSTQDSGGWVTTDYRDDPPDPRPPQEALSGEQLERELVRIRHAVADLAFLCDYNEERRLRKLRESIGLVMIRPGPLPNMECFYCQTPLTSVTSWHDCRAPQSSR
jgi:hypothetical protein